MRTALGAWRVPLKSLEIGVAAETRRVDKIAAAHPTAYCSCEHAGATVTGETLRSPSRRAMKPYRGDTGFVGWSSFLGRASWRRLQAIAIAVLLLLPIGANPARAVTNSASAASTAHVYLLRGVLNIFSLGLDDIAAQAAGAGHPGHRRELRLLVVARRRSRRRIQERQDQDDHSGRAFLGSDRTARHGRQAGSAWRSR